MSLQQLPIPAVGETFAPLALSLCQHPIGLVGLEACLAHQTSQGTGLATMMTMAGLWAAEMQALRNQVPYQPSPVTGCDQSEWWKKNVVSHLLCVSYWNFKIATLTHK